MNRNGLFRVIFLDVLQDLDVNSLQYPDVCLALARRLFAELKDARHINWTTFSSLAWRTGSTSACWCGKSFASSRRDWKPARRQGRIPFFTTLFANITAAFQVGSKVKDEVRTVFKSAYSEFAQAFNDLIAHVEARLFIYCAPIHLIYTSNAVQQGYDHVCKIPALKLHEKHDPRTAPTEIPATYGVLRELILKRAPAALFDPDPQSTGDWSTVDALIRSSGGHLRDLLRLLDYAFEHATGEHFDLPAVKLAVKALGSDYRRFLQPEDFPRLAEIDTRDADFAPNDDRSRNLLFNLALLEYNDFWWQSHPVVRTLPAYREAQAGLSRP